MRLLPLVFVVACGDMSSPLSIVDDLRVLDIQSEPAAPVVGEVPVLTPLVFDAPESGFEIWTWWCQEETCGEGPVAPGAPFVTLKVLACEPGLCSAPIDLVEPEGALVDLPFEGVSLATRTIGVSPSAEFRLNDNPTWVVEPSLPATVAAEETVLLELEVADAADQELQAYLFATVGLVPLASVELEAGVATLEWTAPEEPGRVQLAVVVDDGLGGSAQWQGTVDVQ